MTSAFQLTLKRACTTIQIVASRSKILRCAVCRLRNASIHRIFSTTWESASSASQNVEAKEYRQRYIGYCDKFADLMTACSLIVVGRRLSTSRISKVTYENRNLLRDVSLCRLPDAPICRNIPETYLTKKRGQIHLDSHQTDVVTINGASDHTIFETGMLHFSDAMIDDRMEIDNERCLPDGFEFENRELPAFHPGKGSQKHPGRLGDPSRRRLFNHSKCPMSRFAPHPILTAKKLLVTMKMPVFMKDKIAPMPRTRKMISCTRKRMGVKILCINKRHCPSVVN